MRFFKPGIRTVILAMCLMPAIAFGADVAKIGLVDFQKVLTTSEAGKEAQQQISEKGKEMEEDLKAKGMAIEEARARFEREAMVMSADARAEKERDLKIKMLDFKDLEKRYKNEFNQYNMELVNSFKGDVLALAQEIGKKDGYLLILEKNGGGVLYAPSSIDITDRIIDAYNAAHAKKSKD